MRAYLKWTAWVVGGLLGVFLVAVVVAALVIDPEDYRDEISGAAQQATGRELHINGPIELSFFPWLGLQLGEMQLGNAKGFGTEPFVSIKAAEARLKILPLLTGNVSMDKIVLQGLDLRLVRHANGKANWEDWGSNKPAPVAGKGGKQQGSSASGPAPLAALAIGGVEIQDANISFQDDAANQHIILSKLNLNTGEITLNEPIPVQLDGRVISRSLGLEAGVEMQTTVSLALAQQQYSLLGLKLSIDASGKPVPGGKAKLTLESDLTADLKQQTANIKGLTLNALGLELHLAAEGKQILGKPRFSGQLETEEFVPRKVMSSAGITPPEMADPAAMGKAKLSSRFDAGLDRVALKDLKLQLDGTHLNGTASVRHFSKPVIRYQLAVDAIDVDRYLPPAADKPAKPAVTPTAAVAAAPAQLPTALMRSLDIDGTFKLGQVKVMNLKTTDINATLKAAKGHFRVHPITAKLYQGGYAGDLNLDVSGKTAKLSMNEKLTGVAAGPLLKDFLGKEYATGKANLAAKMTASGIDPMMVRKTLNGSANVSFEKGQIKGLNIGQLIRVAYAKAKKQDEPKEETRDTDFGELKGSFNVKNGLVSIKDLSARSPLFQVAGKGTANLVNERLDLRLETTIVGNLQDAANQTISELKGTMIPITVKGTFADPKFGVDVASVLKERAKKEVQKAIKKEKKKLEQNLKKKAEDALKGLIKF